MDGACGLGFMDSVDYVKNSLDDIQPGLMFLVIQLRGLRLDCWIFLYSSITKKRFGDFKFTMAN